MSDPKTYTKDELDAAVKAATDKIQEHIDKLEAKNDGLLDDLKKAQREARAAKDVKPEDLHAAEDRADKAEAKVAELEKAVKSLTTERDKAVKNLETEQAHTHKLLIEDGLKTEFVKNGINDPDFIDSLTAKFASGAKVVVDGDTRKAMFGDKALADHVKEFAASDAGKKFVSAAVNSGGGASGNANTKASVKSMTRSAYDALPQMEKAALGPQMAKGELTIVDEAA